MAKIGKKKPYEAHEVVYQRMRKEGILVWGPKGKRCLKQHQQNLM